ncbi:MAG: serine/threonine protein kinase [Methanobrevibacter thaueri]|jgi:outer membrane protein assembly factor BamB|uniref:beta-alanine-activating enzyme beta-propeller domain-containing protein n=1 Tax=Methanobrevibacter thaueri TaxID=190975 RepID=UPI0026F1A6AD|nr:PQQ-binding-like beta-propeller repeat protein [Methanobrevibacter thaueri]MBE6495745.1 serine/threonine protein kinase [Methanobrevibacter thaueri]
MYKKILIGLIIGILCLSPIAAENWNSFAGGVDHNAYRDDGSDFVTNLWTFNMESPIHSSPAIYKDYIYFVTENGILKAIDMETGEEEWDLDLEANTNSSPIVHDNKLYIGCEDGLKAININSHKVTWDYDAGNVESTPFFYDDVIYFGSDDGHLYGLDKDGKVKLNKKLGDELKSSPIVVGDNIYIGSSNGNLYSVGTDKEKNWDFTTGDEILSSPSYVNKSVIFGSSDGNVYCLDKADGDLKWKVDLNNKVISSPTVDEHDNSVYIGSDEGNLTCIDVRDGTVKWSHSVGDKVRTTAALKDNLVAFGSNNGYLYVLNKYTGEEEFTYNPGTVLFNSAITSSPVINGNSLFFGDDSGHVYSLNIDKYEVPGSTQMYYSIAVLIIVLIIAVVVIRKVKGRK